MAISRLVSHLHAGEFDMRLAPTGSERKETEFVFATFLHLSVIQDGKAQ